MRLLFDLADIAEDLLFFGMKPPEVPPRSYFDAQRAATMRIAPETEDDDPGVRWRNPRAAARFDSRCAETRDIMWQSIRLVLMGRRLLLLDSTVARRLGDALNGMAERVFDAYCSITPRWLICEWLLGDPTPPPHWESAMLHAISLVEAGARIDGVFGAELQSAGAAVIDGLLNAERD